MTINLVITGTKSITPLPDTASGIKSGTTCLEYSEDLTDAAYNPLKVSVIKNIKSLGEAAQTCLEEFATSLDLPDTVHLLMGYAPDKRPSLKFDTSKLASQIDKKVITQEFKTGNPSAIHALEQASIIISENPQALCIVGAMDSLLESSTIDYYEKDQRPISEGTNRHNGFVPSQAAVFLSIESEKQAFDKNKKILARITNIKTTKEKASFVSGSPSKGKGLTQAVKGVLDKPDSIENIFCDLNGEFHRAKDFGFVQTRCFAEIEPKIWHPADCIGDTGAANAGISLLTAAQGLNQKWLDKDVLIFSSDDYGDCGAVFLSAIPEAGSIPEADEPGEPENREKEK